MVLKYELKVITAWFLGEVQKVFRVDQYKNLTIFEGPRTDSLVKSQFLYF